MADFVKGKSVENPQFLKSNSADSDKCPSGEYRKLRGLSPSKNGCSAGEKTGGGTGFFESLKLSIRLTLERLMHKRSDSA
jgi:hypothetical protein